MNIAAQGVALGALIAPVAAIAQASPSDFTTAMRYDAGRRIVGTIAPDPDGSGPLHYAAVRMTYDATGRVIKVEKGELSGWQDQSVLPKDWAGFTAFTKVETSYDPLDRKTLETSYGWDTGTSAWLVGGVTQYSYDAVGRLDCTAARMNPATYSSLPSSACNPATAGTFGGDRITRSTYDAIGEVLKVQKAYGITTANGYPRTLQQDYATYTYTVNGKVATMTDAGGNKASMAYDGFDRQVAWIFPSKTTPGAVAACTIGTIAEATEGGVYVTSPSTSRTAGDDCEKYAYDRNGSRKKLIKRDGQIIGYNYDALGRVTLKDIPGGTAADVYYGYDLRGLQLYARFASTSGTGIANTFDGFGRQLTTSDNMSGTARALAYEWDADGNRSKVTYPSGSYFTYDHDGLDRLTTIKESGSTTLATRSYDAQGRRASETRGPVTTTYGYDPISRLASLSDATPDTSTALATTFSYNPANQIISKARSNNLYAFGGYVSVSRPYTANGLNQYATAGSATFTYDDNGNLTSDGTTTFTYDVENRLVSTSSSTGTTTQEYDPLGRLWRNIGGTSTLVVEYDGDHIISTTVNTTPVVYVNGEGQDDPLIWIGPSSRYAMQADQQGSIVSLVNVATGATFAINTYDEYGIPGASNVGRLQYTGQLYIATLGMYYYKARFYSPTLGRFMQTDPIGYEDQINLYAYVENDPVNGTDPSGKDVEYKGTDDEKRKLKEANLRVANSDPIFFKHLTKMELSPHTHIIAGTYSDSADSVGNDSIPDKPSNDINKFDLSPTAYIDNASNGKGTSSYTTVSFHTVSLGNVGKDGEEVFADTSDQLAHDFYGHGFDRDQGRITLGVTGRPSTMNELKAMGTENIFRGAVNHKLRYGY